MEYREYVEKIVESATSIANLVADKTRQKTDQAKMMVNIKKAELEREKAYRSLGRIMYQIETGVLTRDDQIVEAACNQVKVQEECIEALNAALEESKAKKDEVVAEVKEAASDAMEKAGEVFENVAGEAEKVAGQVEEAAQEAAEKVEEAIDDITK